MDEANGFTMTRRKCLLGALLAPLVRPLAALGLGPQPYDSLAVMGKLDGTLSVSVPREAVEYMFLRGWTISDNNNGMFLMELPQLDSEVKPDGREDRQSD